MAFSTAGMEWTGYSWRYFVRLNARPYFVWRVWWGDRLVIDLDAAVLVAATPKLVRAFDEAETRGITRFFDTCLTRIDELTRWLTEPKAKEPEETPPQHNPLQELAWKITAAARLAGVLRVKDCAQALRALESIDLVSSWGSTTSFGDLYSLEQQSLRPIVQHALRQIGEVPAGYPPYHFLVVRNDYDRRDREPVSECVPDRATKLGHLNRDMTPREVLQLVGMPDFIRRGSNKVGEFHRWYEQWEYDTPRHDRWETRRLTWDMPMRQVEMTELRTLDEDQVRSDARDNELFNR
jgi:hypothetical protein